MLSFHEKNNSNMSTTMARLARNKKSQKRTRERQRQQGIDELTIEDGVDSGTRERERALAWGSDLGFHQNG
jgi:hypothetical protein